MATEQRLAKRSFLAALALVSSSACDLVVEAGQTFVLGNRGSVFGSGGNARNAPLPAVRVRAGGAVVVQDADVFGGGIVVERGDQQSYGRAGAGISTESGSVQVMQGLVRGGSVVVQAPVGAFDHPAPGIEAFSSNLEISGGSIAGGAFVSLVPGLLATPPRAAPALAIFDSKIRITGGSFFVGPTESTEPVFFNPSLRAIHSSVEIRGGEFGDGIDLQEGSALILGGRGRVLSFVSSTFDGCSELRGGDFQTLGTGGVAVLVFGTDLVLTGESDSLMLTGTLQDGTRARMNVLLGSSAEVLPLEPLQAGCPAPGNTQLVSANESGRPGNARSLRSAISTDGRFVVFESFADDLVPGDTNGSNDIFVRDLERRTTELVSVTSAGAQALGTSFDPSISGDGRFVSFSSDAGLAVTQGVFVRDRQTGETELVSMSSNGETAARLGSNSRVSDDGRFVAFISSAPNLVPGDTNGVSDVFVRDRIARTTQRVSVGSNGEQGNGDAANMSMSADGRFILFRSFATNLIGDPSVQGAVLVHDRITGRTELVTVTHRGQAFGGGPDAVISANGRFVAFSASASLFEDNSTSVTDVFVRDLVLGTTQRISRGTPGIVTFSVGAISADGRFVGFVANSSFGTALLQDRTAGRTERVAVASDGEFRGQALEALPVSVSADGRRAVFVANTARFIEGDLNSDFDVFVRERDPFSDH